MNRIQSLEEGTAYKKIAEALGIPVKSYCQRNNVWYANTSLLSVDGRGEFFFLRMEVL